MVNQIRKPLIIAHRGACSYSPENTMAAFGLALEQNADGIELDAKLSKDGQVVVIHDQTVDRTTNGFGNVRDLTFSELQKLDAGFRFSSEFRGEKIPSLEDVLRGFGTRFLINVELTSYTTPGDLLPEKVAGLIEKIGVKENIIFSSFHPAVLRRIMSLMPGIPAGLLTGEGWLQWGNSFIGNWLSPKLIHPHYSRTTRDFINRAHHQGRKVNTWTVDDPREIARLIRDGVDGIITDDPNLGVRIRDTK
jgi:glycerophosphoryl diester phosphodiesterase